MIALSSTEQALVTLLNWLGSEGYYFITPTPLTHQRIWARRLNESAKDLRDIFGWNLPFSLNLLPSDILSLLQQAEVLLPVDGQYRSAIRVSSIDGQLFLHSAFPTTAENAIFFGPDTYRFVNFIRQQLRIHELGTGLRLLDVGCGSGAGGLMAVQCCPQATLTMLDINPVALRYTAINANSIAQPIKLVLSDCLAQATHHFDLIISNPPYLHDDFARVYRHGGDGLGRALSVRIVSEALNHLAIDGRLLLYTGVAIVDGHDYFLEEMRALLPYAEYEWHYEEIDPDVFGEELERPIYSQAERIAAVGLSVKKRRPYY